MILPNLKIFSSFCKPPNFKKCITRISELCTEKRTNSDDKAAIHLYPFHKVCQKVRFCRNAHLVKQLYLTYYSLSV